MLQIGLVEVEAEILLNFYADTGKATGIVTTSRITHATPAALFAHSAFRGWEYKADGECEDIAAQILTEGKRINVSLYW